MPESDQPQRSAFNHSAQRHENTMAFAMPIPRQGVHALTCARRPRVIWSVSLLSEPLDVRAHLRTLAVSSREARRDRDETRMDREIFYPACEQEMGMTDLLGE